MATITVTVKTDAGDAAIQFEVAERQGHDFVTVIKRCDNFLMTGEVTSTIAQSIRYLMDPKITRDKDMPVVEPAAG